MRERREEFERTRAREREIEIDQSSAVELQRHEMSQLQYRSILC